MKPFDFNKYIKNNPLLKESKHLNEMRAQETVITSINKLKSILGVEPGQSERGPYFDWTTIDPTAIANTPFKNAKFQIVAKGDAESDDEELAWYIYASSPSNTRTGNMRAADDIKDFIQSKNQST